jgi:hypothetical protein
MRKIHFVAPLLLLLSGASLSGGAQSMALELMGSSGGTAASGGFSLSWSVGEPAIAAAVQGSHYLGAGFQQAQKPNITVSLFQAFRSEVRFSAYPNPAGDYLMVTSDAAQLTLRLFDILGRQVMADVLLSGQEQLNLKDLPAGTYLLQVYDEQQRLSGVSKIQHYQL